MAAQFTPAVGIVLANEGGYSNNPKDPGGETKYGISKAQFPGEDIRGLTMARAMEIYRQKYWIPNNLHQVMDQRVANIALDTVVQHGQGPKIIQRAVNRLQPNALKVDGNIGPGTIRAINNISAQAMVDSIAKERIDYMQDLVAGDPKLATFFPGWVARVGKFSGMAVVSKSVPGIVLIAGLGVLFYLFK